MGGGGVFYLPHTASCAKRLCRLRTYTVLVVVVILAGMVVVVAIFSLATLNDLTLSPVPQKIAI